MFSLNIEGSYPLEGEVKPSGSRDSSIKLIVASLFSNQDIILENIPKTDEIDSIIEIIKDLGGSVSWIGDNKLMLNGSSITSYIVDENKGAKLRFASLLAGPLLYRFGKAILPKPLGTDSNFLPMNRWIDTWEALGILVQDNGNNIVLDASEQHSGNITFKISTRMGTANAIFSSCFISGNTQITNAAEESELDDLTNFLNLIGGSIERVETRKIKVSGKNVFHGGYYEVQPDNIEVAAYVAAALTTKGNIVIQNVRGLYLTSLTNFLMKIGARYEFDNEDFNVWYGGENYTGIKVESSPTPGFLTDWLGYAALILNYAQGESILHDTIYVNNYGYVQDLNRMGANIELMKPSEVGLTCVVSDESYNIELKGEPNTVARIKGPAKLKGTRLNMNDIRYDSVLVIAALSAEGKSELIGISEMLARYERFFDKLSDLGARIMG